MAKFFIDGVVGGKRILPEGWVNYSASPTPNAFVGYGAGFWTNRDDSYGATYRIEHGWPHDAFFAKGSIGQYVIVIPSEHLVIARFGRSPNWPLDADGVSRLVSVCDRGHWQQEPIGGRRLTQDYCRPSWVALSTRSNLSNESIASAS